MSMVDITLLFLKYPFQKFPRARHHPAYLPNNSKKVYSLWGIELFSKNSFINFWRHLPNAMKRGHHCMCLWVCLCLCYCTISIIWSHLSFDAKNASTTAFALIIAALRSKFWSFLARSAVVTVLGHTTEQRASKKNGLNTYDNLLTSLHNRMN